MGEVLYSGFLTKSPPEYKINRARWQRRWFVLRRTPRSILLEYYKDQNSSKPKGAIDLNTCEQVDQGLTFESRRSLARAFIFDIVTPKRKFFLVSNTEEDMIRWVRHICLACGFQLEGEDGTAEDNQPTQPINVAPSPNNDFNTQQQYPASAPVLPTEVNESYIPLEECVTGETKDVAHSMPANGGWDITRNPEELFPMDTESQSRSGSTGSNSSIPSVSAPLPPPAPRDSGSMENYDILPALQRPSSSDMQPMYDVPPALLRREPSFKNQDDIYKPVPQRDFAGDSQVTLEEHKLNGDEHDLYAVPPVRDYDAGLYDFPPARSLIKNQNNEMSSSTDKLALDFQQISVRNSRGASDDGLQDLYSVPPSRTELLISPDDGLPRNATPPPRPPKHDPTAATSNTSQAIPPRPPKPQHLRQSISPSSDEAYDVLPGQLRPVSSQQAPLYDVPPVNNWSDIRSPPNGHQWLDSKVPTPGASDVRYINTKQSRQSLPPKSASYLHQRVVPPPHPPRTSHHESDVRYSPGPASGGVGPVGQQESYLPMIGSSESSSVFQYPDNKSLYMAMEGSNATSSRSSVDVEQESYAVMSGIGGLPASRPLPPNFHRQTFSGGQRPPPIDRSSKPDRKASESSVRSMDNIGMEGSFYANSDDIRRPFQDFRPIQSDRTRSFIKRPGQYENQELETETDLFRGRSNTGDSTTSSSSDDLYAADPDFGLTQTVPSVPEEDAYVYKDVPGVITERPIMEGLSSTPIPASLPSQHKDDIEYLEISHDHHEEPSQPPPRPPKPSSPKVEYIDLDLERMQALKQVTERREEEKDGGKSGRGTLTRRDL